MTAADIKFSRLAGNGGDIGEIYLNRPKALNSLTNAMCVMLHLKLKEWQTDSTIKAVIIRGVGERAFCAGGDVRSLYNSRDDIPTAMNFFREEYQMNKAIFHFNKPFIALLDGVTMGGGAGVSMHGAHRVATDFFSFAMPETAIGFFPDIGAGHFLNKCPGKMGVYLGLTGVTITAADALFLKLINYYVPRDKLPALVDALCQTPLGPAADVAVAGVIAKYQVAAPKANLESQQEMIDACFEKSTVEEIIDMLDSYQTPFAQATLDILLKRSPLSLKITLMHLRQAQQLDFDGIMQQDFILAQAFMQSHDFYEGVRAMLIDKDYQPKWRPAQLSAVSAAEVSEFFAVKEALL